MIFLPSGNMGNHVFIFKNFFKHTYRKITGIKSAQLDYHYFNRARKSPFRSKDRKFSYALRIPHGDHFPITILSFPENNHYSNL